MTGRRYTIAVDFDGVIHRYDTPWEAADVIPDDPVEGAIEWLNTIARDLDVVIFTTRGATPEGRRAVRAWLRKHGAKATMTMGFFRVTAEKPPALVYLDDRALRFDGSNFPSAQEVHALKPWHKREES